MKSPIIHSLALTVGLFTATPSNASCSDQLAAGAGLWQEPQDTTAALTEPDCYAWQLFVALAWPGDWATQAADQNKVLGDDGATTWELWRNVRNDAANTVFRNDGRNPGPWLTGASPEVARAKNEFDPFPLQLLAGLEGVSIPEIDLGAPGGNETRMNRDTYEFVRDNTLFNLAGLSATFANGVEMLNFPAGAKEVKARWRVISQDEEDRYHWVNVTVARR